MSVGKSLRFEVFARDGFTCQYCGQRPPDVVLEPDHIHPKSKGGSDDSINLITSCFDCNRGKGAKIISGIAPRPDADIAYLKIEQERAELDRFLNAKQEFDERMSDACDALQDTWCRYLTKDWMPTERVLIPWINRYGAQEIHEAIILSVPAYTSNRFGYDDERAFGKLVPYIGAVLRNRAADRDSGAIH